MSAVGGNVELERVGCQLRPELIAVCQLCPPALAAAACLTHVLHPDGCPARSACIFIQGVRTSYLRAKVLLTHMVSVSD